jgi:tetratricopeptide (TPR) repeat protein
VSRQATESARSHAPGLVPEALALQGSALLLIGDYAAARTALDEAAGTAPHGSATHVMASRLIGQLLVSTTDPHWREATQRAIDLAREAGLADELAQARNVMAVALINFGDLREAEACARQVVEAASSEGNQWMEAVGLLNYSLAAWQLHGVAHARPLLDRCIGLARQVGHTRLLIAASFQSAQFARAQGEYGLAYETLQALIGQAREAGSIREQQAIPDLLVPLCNTLGRAAESLEVARHAYTLSKTRDYRAHEAEAAMMLGRTEFAVERANDLLAQRVDPDEASRSHQQDCALATALLARAHWLTGDSEAARGKFTEAQAILGAEADPVFVRVVAWQARTLREAGLGEEAREIVTAARPRMLRPDPWFLLEGVLATVGAQDEATWRLELRDCIGRMRGHEGRELRAALQQL